MAEASRAGADIWPRTYRGREIGARFEPGLVSVVIPTFNRAGLLPEALESVRRQTYRPIEVVVADDGSTDGTRGLVAGWTQGHADDRFAVRYVYQDNAGQSAAYNLGVVASRGEYIQFLDSDDYLPAERLQTLVDAARRTAGFQVAVTGFTLVDDDKRVIRVAYPVDLTSADRVVQSLRRALWAASALFRRGFMREVGLFRLDLRYGEDWEYGVRVAIRCMPDRCIAIKRSLAFYRLHSGPRIMTTGRKPGDAARLVSAVHAVMRSCSVGRETQDAWAHRLIYLSAGQGRGRLQYLRYALQLPCSVGLERRIAALFAVSPLFGSRLPVRVWRWVRRIRDALMP